jgi:hypothetical protein
MAAAEAEVGVKTETPFVIRNFVEVKLAWPRIYPTTEKDPFTAFMRIQLVEEAEKLQREFIGRDDENQEGDQLHEYDTEMLALLSVKPPTGFPDFPVIVADPKANKELYQHELADTIRSYFYPEVAADDEEGQQRKQGLAYIVRNFMGKYWRKIEPADYL